MINKNYMFARNYYSKEKEESLSKEIKRLYFFRGDDKEKLKKLINLNLISHYKKVPSVEIGDYVTCCEHEESIIPHGYSKKNHPWRPNLTFKVIDIIRSGSLFACFKNKGEYVLLGGLRKATEEEIELYEKHHNKCKQ